MFLCDDDPVTFELWRSQHCHRCQQGQHNSRVHVNVVRGKVEGDEELVKKGVLRVRAGEVAEEAGGGATVGHHVKDGAKLGRLVQRAGGQTVQGIEETADSVKDRTRPWVVGHVVQRCGSENYANVTNEVGNEEEDILVNTRGDGQPR